MCHGQSLAGPFRINGTNLVPIRLTMPALPTIYTETQLHYEVFDGLSGQEGWLSRSNSKEAGPPKQMNMSQLLEKAGRLQGAGSEKEPWKSWCC
jgi:hypothetical protein